tara:strand:+ start:133 stop:513 length:381 start_codon:yes stop_codon:yes gene_type:complete
MAKGDWEYKEAEWVTPRVAKVRKLGDGYYIDIEGTDSGIGYVFEDGYPIRVEFKSLDNDMQVKQPLGRNTSILRHVASDGDKQANDFNSESNLDMDFPAWLGHHSREGWEIFKIRDSYCLFRRQIR